MRKAGRVLSFVWFWGIAAAASSRAQHEDLASRVKAAITRAALEEATRAIARYDRLGGSAGENAAIDYVLEALKADGVPADVYAFDVYASDPISARVEVVGSNQAIRAITIAFSDTVSGLEAPLVDVGDGRELPRLEVGTGERLALVGDAGGVAVPVPALRGAIALIDGTPAPVTTARLELLGVAGIIFVNPEERLNDLTVTTTWGNPSLRNYQRLPRVAVAHVARSGGETLRRRLAAGPVRVRLTTRLNNGWKPVRLVVARIAPPDPAAPYVLLGGHIDGWYRAATDEAAGNAALLALARAFHRERQALRRGLLVAWWPAHSNARYAGSAWFADQFFEDLRARALAYINVDAIGMIDAKLWELESSAGFRALLDRLVRLRPGERKEFSFPGRNSDHSFNGVGLPLLGVVHNRLPEEGGWWFWHTPDDDIDKVDFDVLQRDTDVYADLLSELLARPVFPIDLVEDVEAFGEAIAEREREARGRLDLGEARRRQTRLLAIARRIQEALPGTDDRAIDLAIVRMLRPLNRVFYHPLSPHHPDPSYSLGVLPGLAPARMLGEAQPGSHRYRLAEATLVRERNRLLEALAEAIAEGERLLARFEAREAR